MEKKKRHLKPEMKEKALKALALKKMEAEKIRQFYKEHPEVIKSRIVAW